MMWFSLSSNYLKPTLCTRTPLSNRSGLKHTVVFRLHPGNHECFVSLKVPEIKPLLQQLLTKKSLDLTVKLQVHWVTTCDWESSFITVSRNYKWISSAHILFTMNQNAAFEPKNSELGAKGCFPTYFYITRLHKKLI